MPTPECDNCDDIGLIGAECPLCGRQVEPDVDLPRTHLFVDVGGAGCGQCGIIRKHPVHVEPADMLIAHDRSTCKYCLHYATCHAAAAEDADPGLVIQPDAVKLIAFGQPVKGTEDEPEEDPPAGTCFKCKRTGAGVLFAGQGLWSCSPSCPDPLDVPNIQCARCHGSMAKHEQVDVGGENAILYHAGRDCGLTVVDVLTQLYAWADSALGHGDRARTRNYAERISYRGAPE